MIKVNVSFWCKKCKLDMDLPAVKSSTIDRCEYFLAYCIKCKRRVVRYITERQKDPYYFQSLRQKRERDKLKIDLIQPNDSRFKLWYKSKWEEMEKKAEQYEILRKKELEDRNKLFRDSRDVGKGVIERENAKFLLNQLHGG